MSFIAQGYTTASKKGFPEGTPKGQFGKGAYIHVGNGQYDKQWVDYCCGLGASLIEQGNCLSLPTQQEENLAFRLTQLFPCIDRVKLLKTGSDACECAVRIARAYTGVMHGCGTGYHGWHNIFISAEDPGTGTYPEGYIKCPSFESLITFLTEVDSLAYCIIEPVELDLDVKDSLLEIRRICNKKKIVLIFDEVVTGFRFPEYSVSNYFGIQPDLICLGKGLGNGHSISVVGGGTDIMETEGYFVSGTFFGELSGITAALDTLDFLSSHKINELWKRGQETITHFNGISDRIQLRGYPTRCVWEGDPLFIAIFCQQMQGRGFLLHPRCWLISHSHTSTINAHFIDESKQCISEIVAKDIRLEGALPEPVFKR